MAYTAAISDGASRTTGLFPAFICAICHPAFARRTHSRKRGHSAAPADGAAKRRQRRRRPAAKLPLRRRASMPAAP